MKATIAGTLATAFLLAGCFNQPQRVSEYGHLKFGASKQEIYYDAGSVDAIWVDAKKHEADRAKDEADRARVEKDASQTPEWLAKMDAQEGGQRQGELG